MTAMQCPSSPRWFPSLASLALAVSGLLGCFRSPDLAKIKCVDDKSCPSGYFCALSGQPGGCHKREADAGETPLSYDGMPSVDLGVGSEAMAPIDVGLALDGNADRISTGIDLGLDVGADDKPNADVTSDVPILGPDLNPGAGGTGGQVDGAAGGGGTGGTTGTGGATTGTGGTTIGTGGNAGTGGTTTGTGGITGTGGTTVGTGGAPTRPAGYWMASDWGLTGVNWAGCVWTYVDTVTNSTTTITPQDFTTGHQPSDPYHVSGSVFNDYNSVAVMGFNLTEAITGASNQCAHRILDSTTVLPPGVVFPSTAGGVSINWTAATAPPSSFRIELRGADGFGNPGSRWCATITDVAGPSFIPFSKFNARCWDNSGSYFDGSVPVSAIVFYVPGTVALKAAFDYTINNFSLGTTIGGGTNLDSNYQRVKISGNDGKQYIIQNNNFGNPTGSSQLLLYSHNSFKILSSTGASSTATPAAFPSIYIGANGQIANGAYSTWPDSSLPMQIGAMASAQSSFGWSGGIGSKDFNAAYDLWFARSVPVAGSYSDAVSGELMIWLYKPTSHQPIGSSGNTRSATIGNKSYTVWRGPSGVAATGTDGVGRPVISYVSNSTNQSFSGDLKAFIDDAVANGGADMSAGSGITQAFANTWYLTDVFGGFQIWTGSDTTGLQCTGFSCVVQ